MSQGDIETATIFTRGMRKIQSRFTGIAINTTAEIGQAVSDHVALPDPHTQYLKESEYEAHRSREDLLKQATLSLDFANNKYEVYEGPVNSLTQMPFNTALDFTRASSATARTATGNIQGVLTDEQRLVGNREGLLVEEQRTNVITRSQPTVADNYWQALTDTTLSDVTLAGLPALRVTRDTGTGGLQAIITNTQGNPNNVCSRTMIVRVSDPANQHLKLRVAGDSGSSYYQNDNDFHATYDLDSQSVVYTGSKTGTSEIEKLSVGVFKLTLNQTYSLGTSVAAAGWAFRLSDQSDASDYNTPQVPQGSWFEFTACQREELVGFPTNYIPTAGTQVTRAADNCVRTLGDEFNPSAGTIYIEYSADSAPNLFGLLENSNNYLTLNGPASDFTTLRLLVRIDGAFDVNVNLSTTLVGGAHKVAVSYSSLGYSAVVDGGTLLTGATDMTGLMGQVASASLGKDAQKNSYLNGNIKDFRLFPLRVSDAELITLTGGT